MRVAIDSSSKYGENHEGTARSADILHRRRKVPGAENMRSHAMARLWLATLVPFSIFPIIDGDRCKRGDKSSRRIPSRDRYARNSWPNALIGLVGFSSATGQPFIRQDSIT